MSPAERHKSGEYYQDPNNAAFILVMRDELHTALTPLNNKLDDIEKRMAEGNTKFALHDARLTNIEDSRGDTSTALVRKKPSLWDKFGIAILIGAATAIGSVAGPGIIAIFSHGNHP